MKVSLDDRALLRHATITRKPFVAIIGRDGERLIGDEFSDALTARAACSEPDLRVYARDNWDWVLTYDRQEKTPHQRRQDALSARLLRIIRESQEGVIAAELPKILVPYLWQLENQQQIIFRFHRWHAVRSGLRRVA
jgi:hypothetical protein